MVGLYQYFPPDAAPVAIDNSESSSFEVEGGKRRGNDVGPQEAAVFIRFCLFFFTLYQTCLSFCAMSFFFFLHLNFALRTCI